MTGSGVASGPLPHRPRGAALALLPLTATFPYYALPLELRQPPSISSFLNSVPMPPSLTWRAASTIPPPGGLTHRQSRSARPPLGAYLPGQVPARSITRRSLVPSWRLSISRPHAPCPNSPLRHGAVVHPFFIDLRRVGTLWIFWGGCWPGTPASIAVPVSAPLFVFDPFLVATFQHLHWIAVWDGLVWGTFKGCLQERVCHHRRMPWRSSCCTASCA